MFDKIYLNILKLKFNLKFLLKKRKRKRKKYPRLYIGSLKPLISRINRTKQTVTISRINYSQKKNFKPNLIVLFIWNNNFFLERIVNKKKKNCEPNSAHTMWWDSHQSGQKGIDLHKYLKFTNVQSNQKRTNFITYLLKWMMLIIKSISNIKIRISVMSSYLLYIIPLAFSTASQPSHSCPNPYLFFFKFTFSSHQWGLPPLLSLF